MACAGLLMVTACGAPEPVTPEPPAKPVLPQDVIIVTFAPAAADAAVAGTCNPFVTYQLKSDRESLRLNVNYVFDGKKMMGSGFALIERETSGVIEDAMQITRFKPYERPCSEAALSINEFTCRNSVEDDANTPCPEVHFKGTDMFKSFSGIPE